MNGDEYEFSYVAFEDCRILRNVAPLQSLNYIGDNAFRGCFALEEALLPLALQDIEKDAFRVCHKLKITRY